MIEARRSLVIATGTTAVVPPIPGLQDTPFWTNRDAVKAELLPDSLIVLGGGAIGTEIGRAYSRFGVRMRVTEGVWAGGDVTGHGAFTHIATYQADIVGRDILGREGPAADCRALPRVTFTDPEVAAVGLTESQARDQGYRVITGSAPVSASSRGWIHKVGNSGLIKLVVDADRGVLVGATSVGPTGGEVLGALSVPVHARVPVAVLDSMIWAYPTFHRGIQDALRDLRSNR